ncbi:DUF58 domain-containing protein [Alteromonas sp. ASW11-130]|uniref:DUF58 domain-containing protein n=1 Tax=Alteromonas sp. ASW11-130 TaxID=3015775 RepID=UPI0022425819|nr:DUF58 domain-containing protein [Alteromonas sp. ASW11-130]MCW8090659.1 DUF58 domain-containing protein [Alteromonas sp. ASW11-130]
MLTRAKSFWNFRVDQWLNKRIPPAAKQDLTHRTIFIFPAWFGLGYLVTCAGLFILGANYQNNLMLLLFDLLLGIFLLNLFVSYLNFSRLQIKAQPLHPVFAKGHASLTIQFLSNNKARSPHGVVNACWRREKNILSIDLDSDNTQLCLPYFTPRRGVYPLPRITLYSEYPFGLYRCWTHLNLNQHVIVYPTPLACQVQLHVESGIGEPSATQQEGHDDFYALRPYHQGEPLHRVAWKNVAKGGDWVSKSFSHQQTETGYLQLIPTGTDIELELSRLCYQILKLSEKNVPFGLILADTRIEPSQGEQHKHRCLTALAYYPKKGNNV